MVITITAAILFCILQIFVHYFAVNDLCYLLLCRPSIYWAEGLAHMGQQKGIQRATGATYELFLQHLLLDLRTLKEMYQSGMLDEGPAHVGVEQEIYLVDRFWRPAPIILPLLQMVNDPHFVTEYASFNGEINIDPYPLGPDTFSKIEVQLRSLLEKVKLAAKSKEAKVMLTGILPNLRYSDVSLDNLTPLRRYQLITEALQQLRGGDFEFHIEGIDELLVRSPTPLFEACNTSFQIHYQLHPGKFVDQYNWAQAIAGPVLAAAVNSPMLLGKRLWKETRVALFQQSIDIRQKLTQSDRQQTARVHFGHDWVHHSLLEVMEDNVARFRPLLSIEDLDDSMAELKAGRIPRLKAFAMHNGTVYRWNRICYGITNGKPHLRVENRLLPSGPTVSDEMANAAFWIGLMHGLPDQYRDLPKQLDFDDAKTNFRRAALYGLETEFRWTGGQREKAGKLIRKVLLPIAYDGLRRAGMEEDEIHNRLSIIDERVASARTGAHWILESHAQLKRKYPKGETLVAITQAMYENASTDEPVHRWPLATIDRDTSWECRYGHVDQLMSKDLYTVREDDAVALVINLMDWREIRHMPVEDQKGRLVGLLTANQLFHHYSTESETSLKKMKVRDIMIRNVITVTPDTRTIDAYRILRQQKIDGLPVLQDGQLVGIVTEYDFARLAGYMMESHDALE